MIDFFHPPTGGQSTPSRANCRFDSPPRSLVPAAIRSSVIFMTLSCAGCCLIRGPAELLDSSHGLNVSESGVPTQLALIANRFSDSKVKVLPFVVEGGRSVRSVCSHR